MDSIVAKGPQETTIGDIVEFFDRQRIPLSGKQRKERQGPYPYYGASGVIDHIDDYIFDGRYILIAEDGENLNSRKLPVAFFAEGKFWVNNHAHIVRAIPGIADDDFICAWFAQANISGYITGAAQPKLSQENLKRISLNLPPYLKQKKITAILSAYDNLIENNLRRIKILEEMAQNLYREWFVKFRFPGHENVCMVDSPLGKIPEEWEVRKLSEVCNLVMGQSPKSEFYNDVGEGLPFHQGVTDFGERFPTVRLYCTMQNRLAEAGDILFSVRAPVGRINIAPTQMIIGRGLSAIRHSAGFQWFVFHLLREKFKEEDSMGGGTIFKAVTKSDMRSIELLSADDETHRRFEDMVLPIENQIKNMTKKNETLRQTRDLLLPKLISGELDVSELDIDIRDAA
ncbi:MAG: restriction endonuclease subunit S [Gammaproteobacteria bacterium]|nr:restriction endonuclease subunit S [Gammaproteobacteria bacterium]